MTISGEQMHRGDALWALQMLVRSPGDHVFYLPPDYVDEFAQILKGFPVDVRPFCGYQVEAKNVWIANGRFEGTGLFYRDQEDIMGLVMDYMNLHCAQEGLPPCFKTREDMLLSFPKIEPNQARSGVLVVNAHPLSGQVKDFNGYDLDSLISRLCVNNHVICTNPTSVKEAHHIDTTLEGIAYLSATSAIIIGVATGPIWPSAFHEVNRDVPKYILLNPMRLDYGPTVPVKHAKSVPEMIRQLEEDGVI